MDSICTVRSALTAALASLSATMHLINQRHVLRAVNPLTLGSRVRGNVRKHAQKHTIVILKPAHVSNVLRVASFVLS
jgi:hypothetical protein